MSSVLAEARAVLHACCSNPSDLIEDLRLRIVDDLKRHGEGYFLEKMRKHHFKKDFMPSEGESFNDTPP